MIDAPVSPVLFASAASVVTPNDLAEAKLGNRFGRLDLASQLALLAVEKLGIDFENRRRDRIGICINVRAGSLTTDVNYWGGRDNPGGPSPLLFTYTLPSSALGEIAIRHRLTGPNLCLVGDDAETLAEARDWLRRAEVDACLCLGCDVVSNEAAALIDESAAASAWAMFVTFSSQGAPLPENPRDMKCLAHNIAAQKSPSAK